MKVIRLILHAPGARGMRWFGLGPGWIPTRSLFKLQRLFDQSTFWAENRSLEDLKCMLRNSSSVVSLWDGKRLVGFGRATSDGVYRAVLWDVVVNDDLQGKGLGRRLVEALTHSPQLQKVERVYLMTTNSVAFYKQLGFEEVSGQRLMHLDNLT